MEENTTLNFLFEVRNESSTAINNFRWWQHSINNNKKYKYNNNNDIQNNVIGFNSFDPINDHNKTNLSDYNNNSYEKNDININKLYDNYNINDEDNNNDDDDDLSNPKFVSFVSNHSRQWWESETTIRPNYETPPWMHGIIFTMLLFIFVFGLLSNIR